MGSKPAFLAGSSFCFIALFGVADAQQSSQPPPPQRELIYKEPGSPGWKVTGHNTLGAYSLVEATVKPGTGPQPHRHSREDESFYVLEGQLEFRVGDRTILAAPGSFVFAPKGIPHNFKNVGTTPARFLTIISPAGLEKFFAERNALMKETPSNDPAYAARLDALNEKYGLEYRNDWAFPSR